MIEPLSYNDLTIPAFLRREPDTPEQARARAQAIATAPSLNTREPLRIAPDAKPINRRPLRGAAREAAALQIAAHIKAGHVTIQRLRKITGLPATTIRSAIRRAVRLHLVELVPGTRSYRSI